MATLGLATAFSALLLVFPDVTGGASGLTTARRLDLGFVTVSSDLQWYVLVVAVMAAMLLLLDRMVAGRRGRILRLVRHDELAAAVLGVQVPRLVDELSVIENVALGHEAAEPSLLRRRRSLEAAALARAREALAHLSLTELADRPARVLGTGERKSVELARALASDATVLLLDEPAVGLSLAEVDRLRQRLGEMRHRGMAILVVDHNVDFIESLVDEIYVMASGRVEPNCGPAGVDRAAVAPPARETARLTGSGAHLAVTDLTAGYGRVTVLHGVSFAVSEGEVLGISGSQRRRKDHPAERRRGAQPALGRRRPGHDAAVGAYP